MKVLIKKSALVRNALARKNDNSLYLALEEKIAEYKQSLETLCSFDIQAEDAVVLTKAEEFKALADELATDIRKLPVVRENHPEYNEYRKWAENCLGMCFEPSIKGEYLKQTFANAVYGFNKLFNIELYTRNINVN